MATAPRTFARFGADLALTRFVGTDRPLRVPRADSWGTLDLAVVPGGRWRRQPAADLRDLDAITERDNLAQAIIMRLLTRSGSLAPLGHPDYGSRLVELIGRLNNETTRRLARLFTLEALGQEPRIHQPVRNLVVSVLPGQPDVVLIDFSVLPVGDDELLSLALEVVL